MQIARTARALATSAVLTACSAPPEGDLAATPQRPTLSADTSTTVQGSFELEAGVTHDPDGFDGVATTLKYGTGPNTEVYASWAPYLRFDDIPGDDSGTGDVALGIRHRALPETEGRPALGVLAQVKLPTSDEADAFTSGELDASFAGILTKSLDPISLVAYYQLDVLGDPRGGTYTGHVATLTAGAPVEQNVGAFAELAGVFVPEFDAESLFTIVGLTYAPRPALVFDVAALVGLNDDAPDLQLLIGFTRNFGRPASARTRAGSSDAGR